MQQPRINQKSGSPVANKSTIPLNRDRDYPIFEAGVKKGRADMKSEVLSILEDKYVNSDVVKTDPSMQAVLTVVRELVAEIKKRDDKAAK